MMQPAVSQELVNTPAPAARKWHPAWKVLASVLIMFHVGAMVLASYCAGNASPLVYDIYWFTGPYAQAMYVNHGYRFFSPDPGESTLVEFESLLKDGSRRSETIPNRGEGGQWPRVFYHRHFMLTEFLTVASGQPELFDQVVEAYAAHYLVDNPDVVEVSLVRVIHTLPSPDFIRAGGELQYDGLYIREPLGTFRWDEETGTAVLVEGEPRGELIPPPELAPLAPMQPQQRILAPGATDPLD
jgi:hypothetical protein